VQSTRKSRLAPTRPLRRACSTGDPCHHHPMAHRATPLPQSEVRNHRRKTPVHLPLIAGFNPHSSRIVKYLLHYLLHPPLGFFFLLTCYFLFFYGVALAGNGMCYYFEDSWLNSRRREPCMAPRATPPVLRPTLDPS
jgi:hypothetical protein